MPAFGASASSACSSSASGLYNLARGIQALEQGTLVSAGPRSGPMSGTTAIIIGVCSVLAGGFGLRLILRARRKR